MPPPLAEQLSASIHSFTAWLDDAGYESYDPYDLWGTRYGLFARRHYYAKNPLGLPLIAPVVAAETLLPSVRKLFVRKQRYATADAQLLLAFLNLHKLEERKRPGGTAQRPAGRSGESAYLTRARDLASDLLKTSIPGYSGHCWGYPFDWQNNRGLWKRNTPFITSTPYCYQAFAQLAEITGETQFAQVAESAARFVYSDLNDTVTGTNAAAASYGPHDHTFVINASAYRAWVLFDAARRFNAGHLLDKAQSNLNFILESQRPDGSWLYALNAPGEAFIDHFHTCFVLKNLWRINLHLDDPRIVQAIDRGYAYYRQALFTADGIPKSFAIQPRTQLVRIEMYNFAEAITLGALLRNQKPEALADAIRLATILIQEHQLPPGHFSTRVFIGGIRHTFPFLRWPQAQLFYALTNLLCVLDS